uniref:embryo-specific protein ATS3A-like n=1 Tax=Erigeron canadensis TaxID=72917 RepID=UPI001CB8A17E|nr:embryo-specific protein ATS3A-like [Erigeron canadensis]
MRKSNFGELILVLSIIVAQVMFAKNLTVASKVTHRFHLKEKRNCTYAITIETTCTKGADTSNHVSIRFGDSTSNDILVHSLNSKHVKRLDPLEPQVLNDVPIKPFEACTIDQFQHSSKCVKSPVCYIYLKLTGKDDWRPGFVQIRVFEGSHLSSNYFYIRRYLPRNVWHGIDACDTKVTPFGLKHTKKVFG